MRSLPVILLSAACTPVLQIDGAETTLDTGVSLSTWEAPENTWPIGDAPPPGLTAEGFGDGEVAPEMLLPDQHGDTVSLWQFYGMVIAVDVSTIWCAPCRELAREVDATWEDYRDQGFIYLTVLPEDTSGDVPDQADLQGWGTDYGITAPILADGEGYGAEIEPDAIYPHVLIIDRDMRVSVPNVQPAEDATIRAAIEALL